MSKNPSYSDKEILQAVCENGPGGWNLFYAQFNPLIQCIIRWPKWNFSEHEQQDVSQNTYVQLQKALPAFQQQCSLAWFIKRITIRQCIDEIRRQVRWRTFMTSPVQKTPDGDWCEMEFECPDLNPHHEVIQNERRQALHHALQQLKETCKNAITLFYVKNLSYREISEQLGISTNTVGSRLAKCLNKLHKELRHRPLFERTNS
ncbi:MAG: sigma-70 family RNA polymerase sigma factor [Kiritimatiellales bacterium]